MQTLALLALAAPTAAGAGDVPPRSLLCRNTASGATWTVAIDAARGTVDGMSARIGPEAVRWQDADTRRLYAFDRLSGVLTVTVPSSTGGWVIRDRCVPNG